MLVRSAELSFGLVMNAGEILARPMADLSQKYE